MTQAASKATLRSEYLRRRMALSPEQVRHAAALWMRQFISQLACNGKIVAGYHPIKNEMDVTPLLAHLAKQGVVTALPVTPPPQQPLLFRHWQPGEKLVPGLFSTREPSADAKLLQPDVLIVPLLAFDARRHRLGYGGGYYDATITHLRKIHPGLQVIGAAYELQLARQLDDEPHDQIMDMVVTELHIYSGN